MACCCKSTGKSEKASASCLGRCDLPKHRCLDREEVKPGPVPKHMGWLYTARDAPEHQLRCGWRPGHISCTVLRKIEAHNCGKTDCGGCGGPPCFRPCVKPCCLPLPRCPSVCPSTPSCCKQPPSPPVLIRIIRHGGNYSICTKPSNISNAPSGPYPLKYVLNTEYDEPDPEGPTEKGAKKPAPKYSVEAKYNDYHFDYTSSQSSFVLDFSPPDQKCAKPCPKRSLMCMMCKTPLPC
ncbi:hypothetical protein PYW08_011815 [Mythimna loreyi]|uniref:Uncharacterized protein n=1 Tax=Mythimna loreyi TaxID=667449 RepID=A0ACC2QKI0_9NEOP|nr:hypothetical protein PYW08_011815 [Mythimna loreyi]